MHSLDVLFEAHPDLREPLPLLGLFQGYVSAPILGSICARPRMPSALALAAGDWLTIFDLLRESGLSTRPNELAAQIDPQCARWLRQRFADLPGPSQARFERAFAEAYGELALRLASSEPRAAADRLRPEEQNLLQALALAQRHQVWRCARSVLAGLEILFLPAGHWKEWQWVLSSLESQLHADDVETASLWEFVVGQKAAIARHQKDYATEEEFLRQLREHFSKASNVEAVAQVWRQLGRVSLARLDQPTAIQRFHECLELLPVDHALRAEVLHDLGLAASRANQLELAESSFSQALDLASAGADSALQARLLTLLGKVARARQNYDGAQRWFRRLLAFEEERNQPAGEAEALEYLGQITLTLGEGASAEKHFLRSAEIWKALRNEEREGQALLAQGQALVLNGQNEHAEACYRRSLQLSVRSGNRAAQAEALSRLGQLAFNQKRLDSARHLLSQARALLGGIGEPDLEARILETLGAVVYSQDDLDAAEEAFGRASQLRQELKEPQRQSSALYNLGLVAERRGRLADARQHLHLSLELGRAAHDVPSQLQALLQLAGVAFQEKQFDEARRLCRQSLELGEQSGSSKQLAEVHYRLGRIHAQMGHVTEAREDFQASFRLLADPPDLPEIIKVLGHLNALPNNDPALMQRLYLESLGLAEKKRDAPSQVQLLYQLAALAETGNHWIEAEHYFRRCLTIDQAGGSKSHQGHILQRIGLVLEHLGRGQESVLLYQRSLRLAGWPNGEHAFHPAILLRLGDAAAAAQDWDDAFVYYQHAERLAEHLQDSVSACLAASGLGRVAMHQGDPDQARRWLTSALQTGQRSQQTQQLAHVFRDLGELETAQGNLDRGREHLTAAVELYRSGAALPAQAAVLCQLARLSEAQLDLSRARQQFLAALELYEELQDLNHIYRLRIALQALGRR